MEANEFTNEANEFTSWLVDNSEVQWAAAHLRFDNFERFMANNAERFVRQFARERSAS